MPAEVRHHPGCMRTSAAPFLTDSSPVPIDRPFTSAWARGEGVDPRRLRAWVRSGLLVSPVHGVLYAAQLRDCLELRIASLRLVVPEHAVVTDRTAAWLHGAPMVLEPYAHVRVPRVDMFLPPGSRIRRELTRSGQRELRAREVQQLDGLQVTTPMRTICDLGMKLPRRQAFAAMCSMLKVVDFTTDDIRRQADGRFKGHRWVRQLRALIPMCDPRFESPGECNLALIWHDTPGLPPFEPQFRVDGPDGFFYLDFAVPELGYAAEYDGAEFHGPEHQQADASRRDWITETGGWQFGIYGADDVRGSGQIASDRLLREIAEARRTYPGRARWH
jgi:hypothetical protein